MRSQALARMETHVGETIHRDIAVFVSPRRTGIVLICRTCALETVIGLHSLVQDQNLRELLFSSEARLALERYFRSVPPRDGSSWARILEGRFP